MGKGFLSGAGVTQNSTVTKMATPVPVVTDECYKLGALCTTCKQLQKSQNLLWAVMLVTFLEGTICCFQTLLYSLHLPLEFSHHTKYHLQRFFTFIDSIAVCFPLPFWQSVLQLLQVVISICAWCCYWSCVSSRCFMLLLLSSMHFVKSSFRKA